MPLYLQAPRGPKSPSYQVRGTHNGVVVDRSAGTAQKRDAEKKLKEWEKQIERGVYVDPRKSKTVAALPESKKDKRDLTFGEAATAYLNGGGERRYLARLLLEVRGENEKNHLRREFGAVRCGDLAGDDPRALDHWAMVFCANVTGATRNRHFYTPVSAVLKHIKISDKITRPKDSAGRKVTTSMYPEQAQALFKAADSIGAEFGLFLRTLCFTGMRFSEGLGIQLSYVSLADQQIHLPGDITKNRKARTVYLPPELVVALANHPRGLDRHPKERLFNFTSRRGLYRIIERAKALAGLSFPKGEGAFHLMCHTYATWMCRYNNMGADQLVRTGRWLDVRSAARYNHVTASEESRKADNLPKVG